MDQSPNLLAANKALEEGRWGDAESEAAKEIDQNPNEALPILGKALIKQGKAEQAAKALRDILALTPADRFALQGLASLSWNAGQYQDCAEFCSRLLQVDPQNPGFWNSQGMCLAALGSFPEALTSFREAVRLNPNDSALRQNLARAYAQAKNWHAAAEELTKFNELVPVSVQSLRTLLEALINANEHGRALAEFDHLATITSLSLEEKITYGDLLLSLSRANDAIIVADELIGLSPRHPGPLLLKAAALQERGDSNDSVPFVAKAGELDPKHETPYWALIRNPVAIMARMSAPPAALELLERLAQQRPLTVDELTVQASALLLLEKTAEAKEVNEQILQLEPKNREALFLQAKILQRLGEHEQADAVLNSVAEANPELTATYGIKVRGKKMTEDDRPFVEQMEKLLLAPGRSKGDLTDLHFALGKSYDDLGQYELAMNHFDQANAIQKSLMKETFDKHKLLNSFEFVRESYESGLVSQLKEIASDSETPIFVIGINRSGTTLVEQILSCHSSIEGAGELEFWSKNATKTISRKLNQVYPEEAKRLSGEYLKLLESIGKGKPRVTDKQNANYQYVGLLHTLYPNAKFVVSRRNPIDNCLSIYTTYFSTSASFFHDKANIAFTYMQYQRLLDYWKKVIPQNRLFEVQYEELVENPERTTRNLIEFLGLEWNEACLHPEQNKRVVSTASQWQIRQPIYKTSVTRWKRYAPWLGGLADLVEQDS